MLLKPVKFPPGITAPLSKGRGDFPGGKTGSVWGSGQSRGMTSEKRVNRQGKSSFCPAAFQTMIQTVFPVPGQTRTASRTDGPGKRRVSPGQNFRAGEILERKHPSASWKRSPPRGRTGGASGTRSIKKGSPPKEGRPPRFPVVVYLDSGRNCRSHRVKSRDPCLTSAISSLMPPSRSSSSSAPKKSRSRALA